MESYVIETVFKNSFELKKENKTEGGIRESGLSGEHLHPMMYTSKRDVDRHVTELRAKVI